MWANKLGTGSSSATCQPSSKVVGNDKVRLLWHFCIKNVHEIQSRTPYSTLLNFMTKERKCVPHQKPLAYDNANIPLIGNNSHF